MNRTKTFRVAFSLQQAGADFRKVDAINLHWYLTQPAVDLLGLKTLLKHFPPKKGKDFSAFAMEQEMKSSSDLRPSDEAWLTVAKTDARTGIYDIGLELTPKKGLTNVQGGAMLITALLKAGWQPVVFETIEKKTTEQRKVVEENEALKKIIFKLSFQRPKPGQESIEIPPEVLKVLAGDNITWGFSHIWYNPVILKSINVNFTKALFWKRKQPYQWEITL